MRTNIEIDDKLMEAAMVAGGFKTKREAVEEGLRMIKRRIAYDGLLAAYGTLHWDDSDEGWARWREQQALLVKEAEPEPYVNPITPAPVVKVAAAKRGRVK